MKIKIKDIVFKGMGLTASVYIIIFVMIMYSGSTFISGLVMQLVCLLIVTLFFSAKVKGIKKLAYINKNHSFIKIIMAFIIIFLLYQLNFSYNRSTTFVFLLRFFTFSLLFLIIPSLEVNLRVLMAMKIYSYIVAVSILLMTFITGKKSGGLVGSYQFSGMLMSVSLIIFLISYYSNKNKMDLFGIFLMVITLMTSGKRSFTALIILSYIVIFILYNSKENNNKFLKLSVLLIIGVVLAYIFIPSVRLVFERLKEYSGDKTYNGRIYYWIAASQIFERNKLKGIGMGCFSEYFDQFFHRFGNLEAYDAHNVYIQLLAETGLIGEFLFILLFIVCLIKTSVLFKNKIVKTNKKCKYVLSYSFTLQLWFICYCMTGNPLYGANQCFFYFSAVAMMMSVSNYIKNVKPEKYVQKV